jgi:exonuclease SbcD
MRFLHTSDWHLGRMLHGVDLIEAQHLALRQICELVSKPLDGVPIDAVIIAGDIYDRAVPPLDAVTLFASTLAELTRHTTVIATAGNHDSAIRLGFGSELFTGRLRMCTELGRVGEPVLIDDGSVAVYPLPYLDPDAARTVLATGDEPLERSHQAVMTTAMDRVRADLASRPAGIRSVVIAHAFVVGGAVSDSERSIVVGGVDNVAADTFAGVDYVALGHLHGAQRPATSCPAVLRYSGSPLRYSFSERGHTKSITLVDLAEDGSVTVNLVPIDQPREMADLNGTLADLLHNPDHDQSLEDWVRVTVTDRVRPDQMFDRIKSRFPHALQIFHLPEGAEPAGQSASTIASEQSPRDLINDFVRHVTGLDALDEDIGLFERTFLDSVSEAGAA